MKSSNSKAWQRRAPFPVLAGGLLALMAGCSSIPEPVAEMAGAQAAAQSAQSDDATQFAPVAMDRANEKLRRAGIALRQEEFAEARRLAEEAQADADAVRLEREEALAAAQALRQQLEALQAVKTERGMVMTLGDVLFETGKAALQPGAMSTIERLSAEYPGKTVLIEGHTDSVGADSYNQTLPEQRAEAVRAALLLVAVGPGRISTMGYGESRPIVGNDTAAGRLKNRRVEIVIRG